MEIKANREEVKLVLAKEEDAEAMHNMKYKAFLPLYERYHDDESSPAKETLEKTKLLLKESFTDYFLILWKDETVGAVRIKQKEQGIAKISPIYIVPEYQNYGIASVAIELLFARYPKEIVWRLATILQEKRNCHLYEKCGFRRTGSEKVINECMTIIGYER